MDDTIQTIDEKTFYEERLNNHETRKFVCSNFFDGFMRGLTRISNLTEFSHIVESSAKNVSVTISQEQGSPARKMYPHRHETLISNK